MSSEPSFSRSPGGRAATPRVAVIGGGPAGLAAAEVLAAAGHAVDLFDAMPSVGRKFLLAGVGGMNLTHSEPPTRFGERYGSRAPNMAPLLERFGSDQLRAWARGLGVDTFIGTSGRVFPSDMKAAPLLRAWLHRLRVNGVRLHVRHRWLGWTQSGALRILAPAGERHVEADAVILALGGGSWPRLGSDGAWVPALEARGVPVAPLRSANCGFECAWSEHFRSRFAGAPLKPVAIELDGERRRGEFVITEQGVEGSLVYALSGVIREQIETRGSARIKLDLSPDRSLDALAAALSRPRGSRSLAKHLRSRAGIEGVKAGLLRELAPAEAFEDPALLARTLKSLSLTLERARPLAEAISSAGGVPFEALTTGLMLEAMPGVFCAGEMLDWEAPTGGYLLTGCFASGRAAGEGALEWLRRGRLEGG